jgi:hypothetical protein
MTHEEIKILISAYMDAEATPAEKNIVEEHLRTCQSCQKDFKTYTAMSSSLSKWPDQSLSPDEEINIEKGFQQRREPMFTKRSATIFVTTLCLTLIVGSVTYTYFQKETRARITDSSTYLASTPSSQGRLKEAADDIGDLYSSDKDRRVSQSIPYVPNHMESNSPIINEKMELKAGLFKADSLSSQSSQVRSDNQASALGMPFSPKPVDASTANYYQDSNAYYASDEDRKKIQTADISLLVDNAFKTKAQLTDLIIQTNGIIMNSEFNRSEDGAGHGTMVCKVYPKDLEHTLQQIRKLGEVDQENESSADVTNQYNDVQDTMTKYTSQKDRLQKTLTNFKLFNPTTDQEKENIQNQIKQTQEEIDALEREIKSYKEQTSMSLITVNYHDNFKGTLHDNDSSITWKTVFENRWKTTVNASLEMFTNIFFGIIYLLSFLVPVLIWSAVFAVIYFIISLFFKK